MKSYTFKEIEGFCKEQLKSFSSRQLILLDGDLGAGKTTLIQKCVEICGGGVQADSPTFSVINEYETSPRIFHVDLYRLESAEEIESTGFWDLFSEESGYIFVEWAYRVEDSDWPKSWSPRRWTLQVVDSDHRKIQVLNL